LFLKDQKKIELSENVEFAAAFARIEVSISNLGH